MPRRVVFFGNCQMLYLQRLFQDICVLTGDSSRYLDISYTDFSRPDAAAAVVGADVLIDQVFDTPDAIPAELLAKVPRRLRVPNIRGDFLWPFHTGQLQPGEQRLPPITKSYYARQFGDSFLNRMAVQGMPAREAVDRYLAYDFIRGRNIARLYEICLDRQQRRDRIAGMPVCDYIEAQLGAAPLFSTPGHPVEKLLRRVAAPVLAELLPQELAARALSGQEPDYTWRTSPIHPGVGRALSLPYVGDHTSYMVHNEGLFTFEEYALRYLRGDCIPELNEALETFGRLPQEAALELAERTVEKAPTSAVAHRVAARLRRQARQYDRALVAALQAATLEVEDPRNFIEMVDCHLASGDLAAAERTARLAFSRFQRHAAVWLCLCGVLARTRNRVEFDKIAALAVDRFPANLYLLQRIARHYLDFDALAEAAAILPRARLVEPQGLQVAQLAADILQRQGRRADAIAALRDALALGQPDAHVYARMAHLLLLEGDLDAAEAAYRRAMALGPSVAGYREGLADVLARQGRRADAIAVLQETIAAGQASPHSHARLGRLLIDGADLAGAEAQFRQAIALDPEGADFIAGLADVLDRQGRSSDAIDALRQLVQRRAHDAHAHGRMAHLLLRQGDLQAAEAGFRRAIALQPSVSGFHHALVHVLARRGRGPDAIAAARAALSQLPAEPQISAQLAHMLTLDGELSEADDLYRRALAAHPTASYLQIGLAELLARQGRTAEALDAAKAALAAAADPRSHARVHSYGRVAHLLARLGDLAGAEAAYRQALALDASAAGLHSGLADVLQRQGRAEPAALSRGNDVHGNTVHRPALPVPAV